jgi:Ca2+-transporting ATPase
MRSTADAPGWRAWVKGAPEIRAAALHGHHHRGPGHGPGLGADGMRVLAVATRTGGPTAGDNPAQSSADTFEQGSPWGLVGLIDPPRPEARAAVAECLAAGIRPVMITGDHPATALAIARDLGIATADADGVLTGSEMAQLDDATLAAGPCPAWRCMRAWTRRRRSASSGLAVQGHCSWR